MQVPIVDGGKAKSLSTCGRGSAARRPQANVKSHKLSSAREPSTECFNLSLDIFFWFHSSLRKTLRVQESNVPSARLGDRSFVGLLDGGTVQAIERHGWTVGDPIGRLMRLPE